MIPSTINVQIEEGYRCLSELLTSNPKICLNKIYLEIDKSQGSPTNITIKLLVTCRLTNYCYMRLTNQFA